MTTTRTVDAAGYDCGVTIHRPEAEQDRRTAVLYLHGGGLLYGERDDLPRPYIYAFLAEGYTLLCLDYPLAPEVSVGVIHQAVLEGWLRLLEEGQRDGSIPTQYAKELSQLLPLIDFWLTPSVFTGTQEELLHRCRFVSMVLAAAGLPLLEEEQLAQTQDIIRDLAGREEESR